MTTTNGNRIRAAAPQRTVDQPADFSIPPTLLSTVSCQEYLAPPRGKGKILTSRGRSNPGGLRYQNASRAKRSATSSTALEECRLPSGAPPPPSSRPPRSGRTRWNSPTSTGTAESGATVGQVAVAGQGTVPMRWYGEYVWRAEIPPDAMEATLCATDAAGNETCAEVAVTPR